jgi:hypothetical protein
VARKPKAPDAQWCSPGGLRVDGSCWPCPFDWLGLGARRRKKRHQLVFVAPGVAFAEFDQRVQEIGLKEQVAGQGASACGGAAAWVQGTQASEGVAGGRRQTFDVFVRQLVEREAGL